LYDDYKNIKHAGPFTNIHLWIINFLFSLFNYKIIKSPKRREEILGCFIFLAFITMAVYIVYSDDIVRNVGISFIVFCTIVLSITTIVHVVANTCISKSLKKYILKTTQRLMKYLK